MTGVQTCALPICFPVTILLSNFSTVGTSPTIASGTVTKNLPAFDTVGDLSILVLRQAEFLQNGKKLPNQVIRIIKTS